MSRANALNALTLFNSAVSGFQNFITGTASAPPIDLSATADVLLTVTVPAGALTGTTPSITVQLDGVDPAGSPIPAMVKTAAITAAGTYTVSGGLHSAGQVLPATGRITAVVAGAAAAATGIQITLTGR